MKWLGWGLALLLGLILWGQLTAEAHLRARIASRDSSIAVLQGQREVLAGQLVLALAHADTVRDSVWMPVRTRVESLPVNVPVPYPVYVETVAAADTTIRACQRALHDCAAVTRLDSLLIDSLSAQVHDLRHIPAFTRLGYVATDGQGRYYGGVEALWRPPLLPVTVYGRAEARLDSLALGLRAGVAMPF